MDDVLWVAGVLFDALGAMLLVLIYLYPESARREKRRVRTFNHRARDAGLRGRYDFTRSSASGGYGTYEPADNEDRVLFAAVGSRIEGESAFFAKEMLWTDKRLAWVGVPLLAIGVAITAASVLP